MHGRSVDARSPHSEHEMDPTPKFKIELHDVSATGDAGPGHWSATPVVRVTDGDDQRLAEVRGPSEHEVRELATAAAEKWVHAQGA